MEMTNIQAFIVVLFISFAYDHSCLVEAKFSKSVYFNWGAQHSSFLGNGDDLKLVLDATSGSSVQSKRAFLFGSIEMLIKLVPGNSAGTVTAYYLSSTGDKHDEIDIEFLSKGCFNLHPPSFDNSNHYTLHQALLTNQWYVDSLPIRVFRNYQSEGIDYPDQQGMRLYSSLWNADNWATQGGLVKIDWNCAPFIARFRRFRARACKWDGAFSTDRCALPSPANWWTSPVHKPLSFDELGQMKWVRNNYMIYDYCKDVKRFSGLMPPECGKAQY